jgi:hypothetical protein
VFREGKRQSEDRDKTGGPQKGGADAEPFRGHCTQGPSQGGTDVENAHQPSGEAEGKSLIAEHGGVEHEHGQEGLGKKNDRHGDAERFFVGRAFA